MQSRKMFSVREAAEFLGLSEVEVRQLAREGKLNSTQSHLRHIRFAESEVLSFKKQADSALASDSKKPFE